MSKITRATFKKFIKNNIDNLYINVFSKIDAMIDGHEHYNEPFTKIVKTDEFPEARCGIKGCWLVRGSRDYFKEYNKDGFKGIEVLNSCTNFVIAIKE